MISFLFLIVVRAKKSCRARDSKGSLSTSQANAATTVLLYAQGVRKVRNDVLEAIPFVGDYFRSTHELPASDNPF